MKMKALASIVGILMAANVQNLHAVGLIEVLENARKNDPAYKSALAALSASQHEKMIGRSGLLPSVSASAQQGKAIYDREQLTPQGQVISATSQKVDVEASSLVLRQTLFNLDAWSRNKIGEELVEVGELEFRKRENEFHVKVVTAYLNVLRQLDIRNATAAEFQAMKGLVSLTESQLKGGEANRLNLLEAVAKRDIAEAFAVEAEQNLESAVRVLEAISDLKIYSISTLPEGDFIDLTPDKPVSYFRELALQTNPDIGIARRQIEIGRYQIERASAGHYPRVDFVLSQNNSENDNVNNLNLRSDNRTAVVQVQVPIFSGYAVEGERRKNVQLLEKAKADFEAIAQQVMFDLRKHHTAATLSNQKAKAFERAVASSQEVSKANEIGLRAGLNVEYDALNARQTLTKAQLELSKVRYDAIESALLIRATVGQIDAATLEALGQVLNTQKTAVALNRSEEKAEELTKNLVIERKGTPANPVAVTNSEPAQPAVDATRVLSTIVSTEQALELTTNQKTSAGPVATREKVSLLPGLWKQAISFIGWGSNQR